MVAEQTTETLGAFIDERYAPWAQDHLDSQAAASLRMEFADWLAEPLASLSSWRIETWRRGRLDEQAQPTQVTRQLQELGRCLDKAVEWQLIKRNPLRDVDLEGGFVERFVDLTTSGVGHDYLREGWGPLGIEWTWTLGKRPSLEFPLSDAATDCILQLDIAGVYKGTAQRLIVAVNDTTVGLVMCRGPASFEFFVPVRALEGHQVAAVTLKLPDARPPVDIDGSADKRFLGLRMSRASIRPMQRRPEKVVRPAAADDDLPDVLGQRTALMEMASLGLNCEFGFVQRYLGAEPMSLFRWGFIPIDNLILGLEREFAGLNSRANLDVTTNPDGEFVVEDVAYGYRYHTFVYTAQGGTLERVQRNEYIRIGVLRQTLLRELRDQSKLFVYHDADTSGLGDVRRLVAALRGYGDNCLLWITAAPAPELIGQTMLLEPGLIRGYVSGFQTIPIQPVSAHLPSWIRVACRAHRIWRDLRQSD